jgi:hypothetical protein
MEGGIVVEGATILVLILTAGVIALLVWFEINSRRNQETAKQGQSNASAELYSSQDTKRQPASAHKKAA